MKKNLLSILAFVPLCLFSQIKIGQTPYTTLDDACNAANDGDVITISGKYTHQSVFGITKNLKVKI